MSTEYTIELDDNLKSQAFEVIEGFGLTPVQFFQLILKQVADTGSLPLSFEKRDYQLSDKALSMLAESEADIANGNYTTYQNVDELIKSLEETEGA